MINGDIIRILRQKSKITKYKLAQELGVFPSTVGSIENGVNKNPGIVITVLIANYFKVTVDSIVIR